MSYHTLSLINSIETQDEFLLFQQAYGLLIPTPNVRKIFHPFKGIIAQYDVLNADPEEMLDVAESNAKNISNQFPNKKIAFIEVECFGGQCISVGKIIQQGEILHEELADQIAHLKLLKQISELTKTWHFEPFTRAYFTKKGGIWGQVNGENFKFFCIDLFTNYNKDAAFRCEMTQNEFILEKKDKYFIYLMEPFDECIKILGTIYDDSEEVINELKEILEAHILYLNAYVFIELIDKEEIIEMENLQGQQRNEVLYRYKGFNDRPFEMEASTNNDCDKLNSNQPRSLWHKLKGLIHKM